MEPRAYRCPMEHRTHEARELHWERRRWIHLMNEVGTNNLVRSKQLIHILLNSFRNGESLESFRGFEMVTLLEGS